MSINELNGMAGMALQQAKMAELEPVRMSKDQMEAAHEFESYMVGMMVKEMRRSIPDGVFTTGAMDMFSGLFDQEISKRIADSGGLGFDSLFGDAIGARPGPSSAPSFIEISPYRRARGAKPKADGASMPVDGGIVTSKFGARRDPFHGKKRMHKGLDIAAVEGTPITPIRPGTVVSSGVRGGYGNVVVVDHGDGTTSLYAHCHELKVEKGDKVGLRDVIATVGSTGRSTGPHLHLEVHKNGTAIDPLVELDHDHDHDHDHAQNHAQSHDHNHDHDHDHNHDHSHDQHSHNEPVMVRK